MATIWSRAARIALVLAPLVGAAEVQVERVTTAVPFPRGLAFVGDDLYVLARGRVRGSGGVSAEVEDQAGTIFAVDPEIAESIVHAQVGAAVRTNGRIVARPTDPPFRLWNRQADPPESDRRTDRPYCTLRYHDATKSFYICAFSGVDLHATPLDPVSFSKNPTDAVLRYDLRTQRWYELERHDATREHDYPHHDVTRHAPPHGYPKGPDNCLAIGNWLYVVAKDNSLLLRYDLSALVSDPDAPTPPGEVVLGEEVEIAGLGRTRCRGHSGLAHRDGWLYLAYRTTSEIVRLRVDARGEPSRPITAELLARFDPFDPVAYTSADLTDIDIDAQGRVYVISASPARLYRFTPDPKQVFDARRGQQKPWADLAAITGNPTMKCENVTLHGRHAFVTSGDGYAYQARADGTVYRLRIDD